MRNDLFLNCKEIFVIGDIHGCLTELVALVESLPITSESMIVFLGDYIDRGSQSAQVVDYILQLKTKFRVVTLMGNHEAMFLDFLKKPQSSAAAQFIFNGGGTTLASYGDGQGNFHIPDAHMQFYTTLLPFFETESYFMVHGGVPEVPLDEISMKKHGLYLLWAREPFLSSDYQWGKIIVHGHTPVSKVSVSENRINLDTGCIYNNKLSAIALSNKKIFSVEKAKTSEPLYLRDVNSNRRSVRFKGVIPISVLWNEYKYVMETLDYNEFGLYVKDITSGRKIAEGEFVTVKIQTNPFQEDVYRGEIVRSDRTLSGVCYAIKFIDS